MDNNRLGELIRAMAAAYEAWEDCPTAEKKANYDALRQKYTEALNEKAEATK